MTDPVLTPDQLKTLNRIKEENIPMDLDSELDELSEQVDSELNQPEEPMVDPRTSFQEEVQRDVLKLLADREDAPSQEQIDAWKDKYGDSSVQLIGFDKDNVYIYTHLTLGQWEKIQEIMQKAQGTSMADNIEKLLRDKVVRTAILWPQLPKNFFQVCRAGLPDTLYQLILIQSYFLSPQQAMSLTTQL